MEDNLGIEFGRSAAETQTFFHREQNFTDPEQTDNGNQKVEPVEHLLNPKCQPQLSGDLIKTNGAKRKAKRHRGHGFERRFLAEADETAESQEIDRKNLSGTEAQREVGDERRDQGDHDHGEQRADKGGGKCCSERFSRPTLLRHRIAVERRCYRPWFAGYVEKNRRDRAAEKRAP